LNLRRRRGEATKVEGICVADGDGHDDDDEHEEGEEEEEEEEDKEEDKESQIPEDADDEVTHIPHTQKTIAQSQIATKNSRFNLTTTHPTQTNRLYRSDSNMKTTQTPQQQQQQKQHPPHGTPQTHDHHHHHHQ